MMKRNSKMIFFIIVMDIILYDFVLLTGKTPLDWNAFLYHIIVLDVLILCVIHPFLKHYKIRTYETLSKEPEQLRLLYQTRLPDTKLISEDDLYDIINIRTNIPEHTCSKSEYIKYLKRKGLLIVNGQNIWLYGTNSEQYDQHH